MKYMELNICHIGYPKTGTTYLQQNVFNQLKGLKFIYNDSLVKLFNKLSNNDDTILNLKLVKHKFDNVFKDSNINLCSYEPLTGQHHLSGFINRTIIARRLKRSGFNKIIISIRNQYDIIGSSYKQYIKSGGVLTFDDYFNFTENQNSPYFRLDYFNYFLIAELYVSIFGKENVLIIQYEHLNSKQYFDSIFNFIDLPSHNIKSQLVANKSISKAKTELLRKMNHFAYSPLHPSYLFSKKISTNRIYNLINRLPFFNSSDSYLTKKHTERICEIFEESNSKLEAYFNLKLSEKYPKT